MLIKKIKRIARQSKIIKKIYYISKSAVISPLKLTSLKSVANTLLPIKDLYKIKKMSLISKVLDFTMCNYPKLSNIYDLANEIENKKLEGAFVECGTYKGGCAAIMGYIASQNRKGRKTWYFDSFEGMPEPTKEDVAETKNGRFDANKHELTDEGYANATVEEVEEIVFKILNLSRDNNIIVPGLFENTLPKKKKEIGKISILRLDADWYESTKTILEELYDQVIDGGYIVVDDYGGWLGCRKAIHEFFDNRKIVPNIKFITNYEEKISKKIPAIYFKKGKKCENESLYNKLKNSV